MDWWPSQVTPFERIRMILSDYSYVEAGVAEMANAGRDGNGYEWAPLADGQKVLEAHRLHVPVPMIEGEDGEQIPSIIVPDPAQEPPKPVVIVKADSRGGWALNLPGLDDAEPTEDSTEEE